MLKYVWFWPNGGHVDALWGDGSRSAAVDAFARTSRRVTERYSEALAESGIQHGRASIQMMVGGEPPSDGRLDVRFHLYAKDEVVRVDVPPRATQLAPQERALLVLEVVDAVMMRLGQERGWSPEGLRHARQHALDHRLSFEMSGAWKTNPSRTRRARPVARLEDDGFGTLCFEVQDAKTGDTLGFTQRARTPLNSLPKFKRSFDKLRWPNNHTLERPNDWQARWSHEWGVIDSIDLDDLQPWPRRLDPVPERPALPVNVIPMS